MPRGAETVASELAEAGAARLRATGRSHPVASSEIVQALVAAGIINDDISTIRRVVLDLQAGKPAVLYVERHADRRWLDPTLILDGVEVHPKAENYPEPDRRKCGLCHGPGDQHTLLIDAEAKLTRCRDQQTCHARRVT